ncbi:MAG: branched-chain amino acid transporter substrate-binding protein, partial [Firmicutes bacterium]|nr:branched-chain amino acid transporter substrate-binding protein [Bacillota bacterium]
KTLELFSDDEVNGVYVVLEGVYQGSTTPLATKFRQDFKAKYNLDADANAALHYDGTMMLGEALKQAGTTDNKAIRDALQKLQNFEGTTCTYTMHADGESCFQYAVYQFNKKAVEMRKTYDFGKK